MEARHDILVYTSEPFKEGIEVSGPITPTLYVSSDAKDTDFTVKVLDVYPDGRAYNLDESIQRMRYRDGYDKPPVWMEKGKVYKVTLQPLTTSNYFAPGHRLRIEVSSSNFPRFDRNLNTGGNNYDEAKGVVAHNVVHHSKQYPSSITISVVKRTAQGRRRGSRGNRSAESIRGTIRLDGSISVPAHGHQARARAGASHHRSRPLHEEASENRNPGRTRRRSGGHRLGTDQCRTTAPRSPGLVGPRSRAIPARSFRSTRPRAG